MAAVPALIRCCAGWGGRSGIKILGARGGGYMLGFTDDCRKAAELLRNYDVLWLNPEQENCGGGEHAG